MINSISLEMQSYDYEIPPPKTPSNNHAPESCLNATNFPLHIERPSLDTVICPPKRVILKSFHNQTMIY